MSTTTRSLIVDRYTGVWRPPNASVSAYYAGRDWMERLRGV